MASLHRGWLLVCTMLRRQRLLGCTRPHTLECARREFFVPRLLVTTGTSSHRSQEGDTLGRVQALHALATPLSFDAPAGLHVPLPAGSQWHHLRKQRLCFLQCWSAEAVVSLRADHKRHHRQATPAVWRRSQR